jgi:hypothetical protein
MLRTFQRTHTSLILLQAFALGLLVFSFAGTGAAQLIPASPPVADPRDHRFDGVHEDWTTPALASSKLLSVRPILASTDEGDDYTLELYFLQWRWGDPLDVYVVKPKGVKKPPVILYLYGYPAETDIFREKLWDEAVTREGFAAVGFVSALTGHRYHDRPMREWFVSELQESLATSTHDVQKLLDFLATCDDLDTSRVGMFTQGAGATIGILSSAVDPRIKVLDALDPWGDWPTWMATSKFVPEEERASYVTADFLKKVAPIEPIDWLPKVQATKFRFQQTVFDTVTPSASRDKLRAAVPGSATVNVYKTPEQYAVAMVGNKQLDWIRNALRSLPASTPDKAAPEPKTAPPSSK